jgi:iron complex outermembrane receptor protein
MSLVAGVAALTLVGSGAGATVAPGHESPPQDLTGLSLEELANIEVNSVSRRREQLAHAAASVYVITRDDIRRSGAASLPEVLRLAPNLQVQRVNAGDYAISARGFNSFETANKLLVLIDGRSIYTTLFSGVLWDAQGVLLEDIERIEVISGPGGALYGSNAVNGVINITTRSARDTAQPAVSAGLGDDDRTLSVRSGGQIGDAGAWRLFATGFDRSASEFETGGEADDATAGVRIGGRADWNSSLGAWMVEGDAYDHEVLGDTVVQGGHLQGQWRRNLGRNGDLLTQAYYDRADRTSAGSDESVETLDLLVQHAFTTGSHALVWGGGYRWVENSLISPPTAAAFLSPETRRITLANIFIQDQVALTPTVTLTAGVKIEDSSFTGIEFLPNVRLAWVRDDGSLVWGAISRAARTANRIDRDLTLPGFLVGGEFRSEQLTAWELGYRAQPTRTLSYSISAFYNDYDDLRTVEPDATTFLPFSFANGAEGQSWGVEAWGSYQVNPRWRLELGAATLEKNFGLKAGVTDISGLASIGDDPGWQVLFGSKSQLTDALELDVRLRAVDELDMSALDGYVEADVRLGWRLPNGTELAVTGSNLLDDSRLETGDPTRRRVLGRSIYATLRAGF